jgi:hypothetical protein
MHEKACEKTVAVSGGEYMTVGTTSCVVGDNKEDSRNYLSKYFVNLQNARSGISSVRGVRTCRGRDSGLLHFSARYFLAGKKKTRGICESFSKWKRFDFHQTSTPPLSFDHSADPHRPPDLPLLVPKHPCSWLRICSVDPCPSFIFPFLCPGLISLLPPNSALLKWRLLPWPKILWSGRFWCFINTSCALYNANIEPNSTLIR